MTRGRLGSVVLSGRQPLLSLAAYTQLIRMLTVSAREEAVHKEEGGMTLGKKNKKKTHS